MNQAAFDLRPGKLHRDATQPERDGATANLLGKSKQRAKVYGLVVAAGSDGLTGHELSVLSGIPRHVLSGRLRELEDDKLIIKSGRRRLAPTGVRNSVYVVASK